VGSGLQFSSLKGGKSERGREMGDRKMSMCVEGTKH
jgi:hypothetical protein